MRARSIPRAVASGAQRSPTVPRRAGADSIVKSSRSTPSSISRHESGIETPAYSLARALYALASYRWVQYLVVSRYESAQQWQAYQEALLPQIMVGPLSAAVRAAWAWLSS